MTPINPTITAEKRFNPTLSDVIRGAKTVIKMGTVWSNTVATLKVRYITVKYQQLKPISPKEIRNNRIPFWLIDRIFLPCA